MESIKELATLTGQHILQSGLLCSTKRFANLQYLLCPLHHLHDNPQSSTSSRLWQIATIEVRVDHSLIACIQVLCSGSGPDDGADEYKWV